MYSAAWMILWLEIVFLISLSEGVVFKPLVSPSPGVPAENADFHFPLQIDCFRITVDGAPFFFIIPTRDYAQKVWEPLLYFFFLYVFEIVLP